MPNDEVLDIIRNVISSNGQCNMTTQKEIADLVKLTIKLNYFKTKSTYWHQKDGIPMKYPISSISAEIFLQELDKNYPTIIKNRHIQYIITYVDVLTVEDPAITTAESILNDHNAMHPQKTCNTETKNNQQINYFDLSTCRKCNEITVGSYCKPVHMDMVIPYLPNHPRNHKMAAFNFY